MINDEIILLIYQIKFVSLTYFFKKIFMGILVFTKIFLGTMLENLFWGAYTFKWHQTYIL